MERIDKVPALIQAVLDKEAAITQAERDEEEHQRLIESIRTDGIALFDELDPEGKLWKNDDDLFKEDHQTREHEETLLINGRPFGVSLRQHRQFFFARLQQNFFEIGLTQSHERLGVNRYNRGEIYQVYSDKPRERFYKEPTLSQAIQYRELLDVVLDQRRLLPSIDPK